MTVVGEGSVFKNEGNDIVTVVLASGKTAVIRSSDRTLFDVTASDSVEVPTYVTLFPGWSLEVL